MSTFDQDFRAFELAGWSDKTICDGYDAHFAAITLQSVNALLDAVDAKRGARVLDVCCGAGYAAGAAAARGATATGVDFSAAQVELARAKHPRAIFEQADGCALPFQAGTFDGVVNGLGIPHFTDPDAAIRDVCRVLKSGGRFAFTVYDAPERAVGVGAIYLAAQRHGVHVPGLPQGPSYFLFADREEATKRLAANGFANVRFVVLQHIWRVTSVAAALDAILQGSVRAAAALRYQPHENRVKIQAYVAAAFHPYRVDGHYELPMHTLLISANKP